MIESIHDAAKSEDIDQIKSFIDKGYNVNTIEQKTGWTPLHSAVSFGHISIVELLINNGANVNMASNSGFTPLHIAVDQGNVSFVEFLISKEADVNSKNTAGLTPLNLAENLFNMTKLDDYGKVVEFLKKH